MGKQRILKEAQQIAKEYSFWMVSGNISHLYGYVCEIAEKKYDLEIKFDDNFPESPPQMIYHNEIRDLLGDFKLLNLSNWKPDSLVVNVVEELKNKIIKEIEQQKDKSKLTMDLNEKPSSEEEYITPDLDAYPPDFHYNNYNIEEASNDLFYSENQEINPIEDSKSKKKPIESINEDILEDREGLGVLINTELGLIQQEYAYDQSEANSGSIDIYLTITLTKTFIISINLTNYPERPIIKVPEEVINILGDPYESLDMLRNWNVKEPGHIVEILHELERKLFFIKEIENQSKKISGEYQCEKILNKLTVLKVNLLTYGFKEYYMEVDLKPYPNPPKLKLSSELEEMIREPILELESYKSWEVGITEPIEIVREISWLVDKNSRINFEIELLKDHYKNIKYDTTSSTLNVEMKGKMKTEDLTFEFQIHLPKEYPMKVPEIKVINEFEIESHEKIRNDLHTSFNDFFEEWTPFSYLIDLFNLISKKIFEVSVVSCVICHKIECPSCTKKIAGEDNCHTECPHCNRAYHKHCWEQTIKSFGKCGFCLR
jgi:ubiquitin-protein ligase